MALTTYEQATRCPKCETPGKLVNTTRPPANVRTGIARGTKVETYECVNERCVYGPQKQMDLPGERWAVQINPDGTIPPKGSIEAEPKEYDIDKHTTTQQRERARTMMERIQQQAVRGGQEFNR
jgi:hypothetical protein